MKMQARAFLRHPSIKMRHSIWNRKNGRRETSRRRARGRYACGAWICLWLATSLALSGCAAQELNAGFPQVVRRAPLSGATKVGVARVEDSRSDQIANSVDHWTLGNIRLIVGPNLLAYIDQKFTNGLTDRGFDPVVALDPTRTALSQPYKVVVLTLQSTTFGLSPGLWTGFGHSSVNIAVQIYDPDRRLIFANSYSAAREAHLEFTGGSVAAGKIVALAADQAIDAAFADPKLEKALK